MTDSRFDEEPKFAVKSVAHDGSKRSRQMVRDEVETMMAVSGRHPNLPIVFRVYEETGGRVTHIVTEAYLGGKLLDGIGDPNDSLWGTGERGASAARCLCVHAQRGECTGTSSRTTSC